MSNELSTESRTVYQAMSAHGKLVMAAKRAAGEQMHRAPLVTKEGSPGWGLAVFVNDPATDRFVQRRFDSGGPES